MCSAWFPDPGHARFRSLTWTGERWFAWPCSGCGWFEAFHASRMACGPPGRNSRPYQQLMSAAALDDEPKAFSTTSVSGWPAIHGSHDAGQLSRPRPAATVAVDTHGV